MTTKYKNQQYNKEADMEEMIGGSRKTIFDDGAGERTSKAGNHEDEGLNIWPKETQDHFKMQEEINNFMDQKMNDALDEDV
jgi:hypothetical protein